MLLQIRVIVLGLLCMVLAGITAATAQTFRIGNAETLKATALDPKTRTIYALWPDSIRAFFAPDYQASRLIFLPNTDSDFPEAFQAVFADSTLYFVQRSGGLVYQLEGDSLRRIDHSFNHKMQINSTIFARNDTLMRYGGYGFWSARNFITYFSQASREWELLAPTGSTEVPLGVQLAQITQNEDHIWVFNGIAQDPVNPLLTFPYSKAWQFDTGARRWEEMGVMSHNFHSAFTFAHMGDRILYGMPNSNDMVVADPGQNRLTYYARRPRFKNVVGKFEYQYESYYHDGLFYLLRQKSAEPGQEWDGELYYDLVPEAEFLGEPLREEPMYREEGFPWEPAGGILGAAAVLGLLLLGRKKYRERDKIVVWDKGIRLKGRRLDLDPKSLAVLNLLLRSPGDVPSQKVLDIVANPILTEAHNIKVKNQLIEALNFRFCTLLDLEKNLIEDARSEEDKRIKVYHIDKSHFHTR